MPGNRYVQGSEEFLNCCLHCIQAGWSSDLDSCSLPCRAREDFSQFDLICFLLGFWEAKWPFRLLQRLWRLTRCCLIVLGLFTELNSRKLLVSFPYNFSIKPAAGFWARSEFWIRLVGIVFIPFLHATFIEEIPCCYGDTGNAFLSCLPVAPWNWGV